MVTQTEVNDFPYTVTLALLGGLIHVRCKYQKCAQQIAEFFPTMASEMWYTPDALIECDWEEIDRYLFRSRPADHQEPLKGVRVYTQHCILESDWPYTDPPIPPFMIPPFKDRFVGLHGAAVVFPDKYGAGLLILGVQKSGKSTLTLELVNNQKGQLLTDETIFIHRRTQLVEPFPRPLKIWEYEQDILTPKVVPANQACHHIARNAVLVTHVLFLEPQSSGIQTSFTQISPSDTLPLFLKHHLNTGCCADEAMVTLFQLAQKLSSAVCRYNSHEERMSLVPQIMNFLG